MVQLLGLFLLPHREPSHSGGYVLFGVPADDSASELDERDVGIDPGEEGGHERNPSSNSAHIDRSIAVGYVRLSVVRLSAGTISILHSTFSAKNGERTTRVKG